MTALGVLRSSSLVLVAVTLAATSFGPSKTLAQTPVAPTAAPTSVDNSSLECPAEAQNGTPAGDRPVAREDFATGLNGCINRVDDLSRRSRTGAAAKTDLEAMIQRQREINLELRSINDRLGNLTNP